MRQFLRRLAPMAVAALAAITSAEPGHAQSEPLIGLTDHNELMTFASFNPKFVTAATPVTGLAPGETLLAIDRMPDTNRLFGLTAGRIYEINELTGAAMAVTPDGLFALTGNSFDMDFIPREYRIRVTSNTGQNIRVSPFGGGSVIVDAPLNFAAADPNGGTAPSVVAIAHTENYGGAINPTLYGIDSQLDALLIGMGANGGTFQTLKTLGFDITDQAGFDVSGSTGHAFITTFDGTATRVHQVFLPTGRTVYFGKIAGGYNIIDIAAAAVPEPAAWAMMLLGIGSVGAALRRRTARDAGVPA